jgi:hypothetical protein
MSAAPGQSGASINTDALRWFKAAERNAMLRESLRAAELD